jgi:6-phosphofructokinase
MDIRSPVLVIICGGSPAPGMNGVISALTIEAINSGLQVIGVFDGFKHIRNGNSDFVHHFAIRDVSSLHDQAGCFLRTSRAQLGTDQEVDNALRVLQMLRADHLVTIGGTETAHSAYLLSLAAKQAQIKIAMVHVPKTIFNDLPLPPDAMTFGFSTARDYGVELCKSLRTDARTLNRYYFITIIGTKAGRLALSIGKAAAATAVIIPEEFPSKYAL